MAVWASGCVGVWVCGYVGVSECAVGTVVTARCTARLRTPLSTVAIGRCVKASLNNSYTVRSYLRRHSC